jgi:hypothetical protein
LYGRRLNKLLNVELHAHLTILAISVTAEIPEAFAGGSWLPKIYMKTSSGGGTVFFRGGG